MYTIWEGILANAIFPFLLYRLLNPVTPVKIETRNIAYILPVKTLDVSERNNGDKVQRLRLSTPI